MIFYARTSTIHDDHDNGRANGGKMWALEPETFIGSIRQEDGINYTFQMLESSMNIGQQP